MQDSIFCEFYERIKHVAAFSFVLYFLGVVVVLGGAGVWIPVIQDCKLGMSSLSNNMMTYSCSLMAACNDANTTQNYVHSFHNYFLFKMLSANNAKKIVENNPTPSNKA